MNKPIRIACIHKTCDACPAQWEGVDAAGVRYYFRFRWGCLTAQRDGPAGELLAEWNDGDHWRGFMELDELRERLAGVFELPGSELDTSPITPDEEAWLEGLAREGR